MKKIFFSLLIISNFLFSSGFNLSYSQKNLIKETLEKLYNQGIETSITYELLNYSSLDGGWESSEYKYIYSMKTSDNDRIAIFIFEDIYNYNNNIITSLNIKKDFILLVDVNANPKLVWSGYLNNSTNNQLIGIDVSKNNGNINWEAVKSDGISFAFIKATEGYPETYNEKNNEISKNFLDKNFIYNMTSAINEGIYVAPYHFIRVDYNEKISDAKESAQYFIEKIKPFYKNNKLLPPVIDIENPPENKENPANIGQISKWNKKEFSDWIRAFAEEIESSLGVKPILYMNESFTDNEVETSLLSDYKLWIAKYMFNAKNGTVINSPDDLKTYNPNFKPNKDYLFWQYTETANDISGISSTYVDKNLFNGSIDDLKKLLVQTSNTEITYVQPDQLDAETEDIAIVLHGSNFSNVSGIFIEGISLNYFTIDNNNQITIYASKVYGANTQYSVPVGYRKIILKFYDGTKVTFNKKIYVKEKTSFIDLPYKGTYKVTQGNNALTSHYNHGTWDNTYAIDFAMPLNTTIISPVDGEIYKVYDETHGGCLGGGRVMVIKDNKGNYLTFLHLRSFLKTKGSVHKGEAVAKSGGSKGNKGKCINNGYGYHLHFHLWNGYGSPDSHTVSFTSETKIRVKVDGQVKYLYGNSLNDSNIFGEQFTSLQN